MAVGRNDPCPCGSGLKYKKCCEKKTFLQKKSISLVSGGVAQEMKERVQGLFPTVSTPDEVKKEQE